MKVSVGNHCKDFAQVLDGGGGGDGGVVSPDKPGPNSIKMLNL